MLFAAQALFIGGYCFVMEKAAPAALVHINMGMNARPAIHLGQFVAVANVLVVAEFALKKVGPGAYARRWNIGCYNGPGLFD